MIKIIEADLDFPRHADALVMLLNEYSLDPMGGGKALSDYAISNLAKELKKREGAHVILALVDDDPAGLAVCMEGFSTFACKPLLNIHDIIVTSKHRGNGLARLMLQRAEKLALRIGCCKLTLEVLEGNQKAQAVYREAGFGSYELGPQMGRALFWQKNLVVGK